MADVATKMAGLVAEFRAGATLAEWHAQHPGDAIGPFELNREDTLYTGANVDWCARAIQSITLPGGRRVQRYAYFFVPQPTAGQPLPQGVEDPELTSQCMLGHLWVETEETDEAAGVALARELATTIERHLGAAERNVKTTFFGAFAWEEQSRWRKGAAVTVGAYDKSLTGKGRRRVLAFTTTPVAQKFNDSPEEDELRHARRIMREVERATGTEQQAGELEHFLDRMPDPCDGSEAASALSRWLQAAAGWTGERKAAALLVADLTLANLNHCVQQETAVTRERLTRLGAVFEYSELGASWVYVRSWLRQAAQSPEAGSTGDIAFVEWMSTGFQQHCCCLDQGQDFRRVINRGEEFLRQKHAPPIEARVHFLTGDAYRDIVALADGAGDIYADAKDFRAEAPSARRKAIAHYRAGLKIESGTREARGAWRSAWRLIAGLGVPETRFFCVYD